MSPPWIDRIPWWAAGLLMIDFLVIATFLIWLFGALGISLHEAFLKGRKAVRDAELLEKRLEEETKMRIDYQEQLRELKRGSYRGESERT